MKGIIYENSIKIIPEDSIEKRFLNTIYLFKSFYIRTEKSIDFEVNIERLEKNPNLIGKIIRKLKRK